MRRYMTTVIIEHRNRTITQQSLDAISSAINLASINKSSLKALVLSDEHLIDEEKFTKEFGINMKVLLNSNLANYSAEGYIQTLTGFFKNSPSDFIIVPHTPQGYDFAPGLALHLKIPCITAVTDIKSYNGTASFQRLCAGGRVESRVISKCDKAVVTVNPIPDKAFLNTEKSAPAVYADKINLSLDKTVEVLTKESTPRAGDLLRAPVVIAAGKGVATEENMSLLRDMSRLFPGSSIAGSRGACDMGLTDYAQQVGMTGKSISPKIYFACGISGSPQHMSGLQGAGTIVAINRDPEAPIHKMADISIVERVEDFIPEFIKAAKE